MVNTTRLPELSRKQRLLLQALRDHVKTRGYPPTVRELLPVGGWRSTSSVVHHLRVLEELGYITRVPESPRAMKIHDE